MTGAPHSPDLLPRFKGAMRRLASTVTIITTQADGHRHGMAATAVNSVTTAPPTLLICINQSASIHTPLLATGLFAVNLLGTEHEGLVDQFSGKASGEDRFRFGTWTDGHGGVPCLVDAQAALVCATLSATPCGSHTVVIGEVLDIRLGSETRPLVYQDGGFYRTVAI